MGNKLHRRSVSSASTLARAESWDQSLDTLKHRMVLYKKRRNSGDARATEIEAQNLANAMHSVGDSHPEPSVREHWYQNARAFRAADPQKRDNMFKVLKKGMVTLVVTPFVITGAVVFAVGSLLSGIGSMMTVVGRVGMQGYFSEKK